MPCWDRQWNCHGQATGDLGSQMASRLWKGPHHAYRPHDLAYFLLLDKESKQLEKFFPVLNIWVFSRWCLGGGFPFFFFLCSALLITLHRKTEEWECGNKCCLFFMVERESNFLLLLIFVVLKSHSRFFQECREGGLWVESRFCVKLKAPVWIIGWPLTGHLPSTLPRAFCTYRCGLSHTGRLEGG